VARYSRVDRASDL